MLCELDGLIVQRRLHKVRSTALPGGIELPQLLPPRVAQIVLSLSFGRLISGSPHSDLRQMFVHVGRVSRDIHTLLAAAMSIRSLYVSRSPPVGLPEGWSCFLVISFEPLARCIPDNGETRHLTTRLTASTKHQWTAPMLQPTAEGFDSRIRTS